MIGSRFNCKRASMVVAILVIGLTKSTTSSNSICAVSSCGDIHNISYPFRLPHDPEHCGDSRIPALECDHNNITLVLHLFSHDYHVKAMDYYESEEWGMDSNGSKTILYSYKSANIPVVDTGLDKNNCSSLPLFLLSKSNFSNSQEEYPPLYPSFAKTVIFLKCANPVNNSSQYVSTAPCISQSENTYGYDIIVDSYSPFSSGDLENGCTVYSTGLVSLNC